MSDEIQSDSRNKRVNEERVKKKRKKSETPGQHELTESPEVPTKKHHEKVHKKKKELEDGSLQIPTDTNKKRKLNEGVEDVTSVHKVKDKKAPPAESQEPQDSGAYKSAKKKKKKKKKKKRADETQEDEDTAQGEQPVTATEHEEVQHTDDQESDLPTVLIGTRKPKRRGKQLDEPEVDLKLLNDLKEFCPKI
ncbi:hypothetical protein M9458_010962, partial [Cirrhinus mrigala]